MQILSENVLWGEYITVATLLAIAGSLFGYIGYNAIAQLVKGKIPIHFPNIALCTLTVLSSLFLYATCALAIHQGAEVEYKVVITDYNEVFNQGFEIVDKEGDISTIKKVGEK
jgi:hypothetical protein